MSRDTPILLICGLLLTLLLAGLIAPAGAISAAPEQVDEAQWSVAVPAQLPGPLTDLQSHDSTSARDADGNRIDDALERLMNDSEQTQSIPVLMLYRMKPSLQDQANLIQAGAAGTRLLSGLDLITTAGNSVQIRRYAELPQVALVAPRGEITWFGDVQTRATLVRPSEDYPHTAWNHSSAGLYASIDAGAALSGRNVTIALTDTGVDDEHPSFTGRWVAGMDATKLDGPVPFDPFLQQPTAPRDGSYNPDDEGGHGTACFGMAAGTGAPDGTYMGAAPAASLVDVRIGTRFGVGPGEEPFSPDWYDSALEGLDWILQNRESEWPSGGTTGIDIVSLSWGIYPEDDPNQGSDGEDEYSQSLNRLVAAGVHVVNAAGNEGPNNDGLWALAAASDSIVVAALDDLNTVNRSDEVIASYSSRGPRRDNGDNDPYDELIPTIAAPGSNIIQADANTNPGGDASGNGYSGQGSGTSYATPAVVGIVALMLEANPELQPFITRDILKATAERRGAATFPQLDPYWNREYGWGMVDGHAAVSMAQLLVEMGITSLIDPDLQSHVDEINVSGDLQEIRGRSWARAGIIDRVEYQVEGGDWQEVLYEVQPSDLAPGEPFNWSIPLDAAFLPPGEQHLTVMAFQGDNSSLPVSIHVTGTGTGLSTAGDTPLALIAAGVLAFLACAAVGWVLLARRASSFEESETGPESGSDTALDADLDSTSERADDPVESDSEDVSAGPEPSATVP